MKRRLSFVALLAFFWLSLSGHFDLLLLSLGAISVALVTVLALRMHMVDRDGHPAQMVPRIPLFYAWLAREVALSSTAVLRMVVNGKYEPAVGRVRTRQLTPLGTATLANSITLTPGTLSLRVLSDEIEVHSLDQRLLQELQEGELPQRVLNFDNPPAVNTDA